MTHRRILLMTVPLVLATLGAGMLARAALALPDAPASILAVTILNDEFGAGAACSLREAILTTNSNTSFGGCASAGAKPTLALGAGDHVLTIGGNLDDANATGDLDVTAPMTITGLGPLSTTIRPGGAFTDRLIHIGPGVSVVISGVRVTGANAFGNTFGAGILVEGILTLINCDIDNNAGTSAGGGILVNGGGAMTVLSSKIRNNTATAGAGIFAYGPVTVTDSVISGNNADIFSSGRGGGIVTSSNAKLTLIRSTVSGNSASLSSGGIDIDGGLATIVDSTISGNSAADSGGLLIRDGGLVMRGSAILSNTATSAAGMRITNTLATLVNSTVSGNVAQAGAGGIAVNTANGRLYLFNTTIANNTTDVLNNGSNGGGLSIQAGSHVSMTNSVLANNIDLGASNDSPDCFGAIHSDGYNHIENIAFCTVTGITTGNVTGSDPGLGGLKNNGGPTLSHMPNAGSSLVDSGDPAGCDNSSGGVLTTDQRGFFRPVNGGIAVRCDKGSIERLSYLTRVMLPMIAR